MPATLVGVSGSHGVRALSNDPMRVDRATVEACLERDVPLPSIRIYDMSCLQASARGNVSYYRIQLCMNGCYKHWHKMWKLPETCGIVMSSCDLDPPAPPGTFSIDGPLRGDPRHSKETDTWYDRYHRNGHTVARINPSVRQSRLSLQEAIGAAMVYNSTLSVIVLGDIPQPCDDQSALLASPWLKLGGLRDPGLSWPDHLR